MTESAPHPQRTQALLMLLVANFLWGLSFPVIKAVALLHGVLLPHAGLWFSTVYTVAPRYLLALLVLMAWRPRGFWRVSRGELKQGLVMGLFAAMGMLLQNDGLQFTAASTSAFLTQFYAILIPVWLAIRARRNPGWLVWACCALVLAGVAILGRFDWRALQFGRGEWETLLSSLFFMGQILWLEKKEFAANRAERLTFVMFATQALVFWTLAGAAAPGVEALLAPWAVAGVARIHGRADGVLHAGRVWADERVAAEDHGHGGGADLLRGADLRLADGAVPAGLFFRVGRHRSTPTSARRAASSSGAAHHARQRAGLPEAAPKT
jgi:drug/metabolite transporter (DMT)-like permease